VCAISQAAEIQSQCVGIVYCQLACLTATRLQWQDQVTVQLDNGKFTRGLQQGQGDRALAGPDFYQ
jgi:hypothetical protein